MLPEPGKLLLCVTRWMRTICAHRAESPKNAGMLSDFLTPKPGGIAVLNIGFVKDEGFRSTV